MADGANFQHLDFSLKRLSADLHNPCYLLHLRDVNILLDCSIETGLCSQFLPHHQLLSPGCSNLPVMSHDSSGSQAVVQPASETYLCGHTQFAPMPEVEFLSVIWDTVDVILISNTQSLLGLPFICSSTGFRGRILATEPVVKFGKVIMDDLLDSLDQLPPCCGAINVERIRELKSKIPQSIFQQFDGENRKLWKDIYSRQSVSATLDRIQLVAYHEPVDIFGLLSICGSSAGFGIGSCNWTITTPTEKVAYISHSSLLYSHALPFDDSVFVDVDIVILGTVNLMATEHLERNINEFRHITLQTLARGGHVLVPSNSCGVLFDLLETALHAKDNFNGSIQPLYATDKKDLSTSAACSSVEPIARDSHSQRAISVGIGGSSTAGRVARSPVFVLSSQSNVSLAYSNAYGEWLNAEKEALLYTADAPFQFQALIRSGQLICRKGLHEPLHTKDLNETRSLPSPEVQSTILLDTTTANHPQDLADSHGPNGTSHEPTVNMSAAWMAMNASTNIRNYRTCGISGGTWPNTPSLMFSTHPSLRFGSVVHLLRSLIFGDLRLGSRAIKGAPPPKHSIILVESGDFVSRTSECTSSDAPFNHLRQLLTPYLMDSMNDKMEPLSIGLSASGVPNCVLSETAVAFWLPIEARLGVNELPSLLARFRKPHTTLLLPIEIADHSLSVQDNTPPPSCTVHHIRTGQTLRFTTRSSLHQPIYLSAQLTNHIRPVELTNQNAKQAKYINKQTTTAESVKPVSGQSDPRCSKSTKNEDLRLSTKAPSQLSSSTIKSNQQRALALVDGLLTTQDGKNWLKDSTGSVAPLNIPRNPPRPSTPPPTDGRRPAELMGDRFPGQRNVFVSRTGARTDPFLLIKELTERGVTGAYVADRTTIVERRLTKRFSTFSTSDDDSHVDYILFPNPNTVIQLSAHSSHILTADESTRTTIRDSILSCLQRLEICIAKSME